MSAASYIHKNVNTYVIAGPFSFTLESANVRNRIRNHLQSLHQAVNYDFSLLELAIPLNLPTVAPNIRPVCLPTNSNPAQHDRVSAIVTGWGAFSPGGPYPNALQEIKIH
ncbi:unnamed protein product, partial [Meganyctiphanes norvegica]